MTLLSSNKKKAELAQLAERQTYNSKVAWSYRAPLRIFSQVSNVLLLISVFFFFFIVFLRLVCHVNFHCAALASVLLEGRCAQAQNALQHNTAYHGPWRASRGAISRSEMVERRFRRTPLPQRPKIVDLRRAGTPPAKWAQKKTEIHSLPSFAARNITNV